MTHEGPADTHRRPDVPQPQPETTVDGNTTSTKVEVPVVVPFPGRYGPPSYFGLSPAELAAEVRRCRRSGWMRWECRVRFGRWAS